MRLCICFSSSYCLYSSFGVQCKVKAWFSKQPSPDGALALLRRWIPFPACQPLRHAAPTMVQLAGGTEMNVISLVPILTFPLHRHTDKPGLTGHTAKLPSGTLTTVL